MDWMFLSLHPSYSYAEVLTSNVMVLGMFKS